MNQSGHDLFSLRGKSIVITGGLGQLGRQYTEAVLQGGGRAVVLDILDAKDAAARLATVATDDLLYIKADITSKKSLQTALGEITSRFGPPFGLVNNAALDSPPDAPPGENGPFEHYPEESWDRVMAINVKGVFLACQVFGDAMAQQGRGSIINVASTYGLVSPDQRIYEYRRQRGDDFYKPVAYTASKASIIGMTKYLATYFAPKGVRVNTLSPGGVFNNQDEEFLRAYTPKVPLGRMARADEYNGAIVFLLSEASSYMTGANLVVDGGLTAW